MCYNIIMDVWLKKFVYIIYSLMWGTVCVLGAPIFQKNYHNITTQKACIKNMFYNKILYMWLKKSIKLVRVLQNGHAWQSDLGWQFFLGQNPKTAPRELIMNSL